MTREFSLDGSEWSLSFYLNPNAEPVALSDLPSMDPQTISVTVPGNAEPQLAAAGVIDAELLRGMKTVENERFEDYDWWYSRKFTVPARRSDEKVFLRFEGVDCIADYYINGQRVFHSENAMMAHRFEITPYIKEGNNTLTVFIGSAMQYIWRQKLVQMNCFGHQAQYAAIRRPAHNFGWDIFPRTVTAGIYRSVTLELYDGYSIDDVSYFVRSVSPASAGVQFYLLPEAPYAAFRRDAKVRIRGVCGDSRFEVYADLYHFKQRTVDVTIRSPKLWYPYGYGEPNVYDVTAELLIDGEVKASKTFNLGLRTAELIRTDTLLEPDHCFRFRVNDVDVMCRGTNWVPLDTYHSRDRLRLDRALALIEESHCNIVRCWGGGVYEEDAFYDWCDRHGVMIWQDFMLACLVMSHEKSYLDNLRAEAEYQVKRLRTHPALVLWSGDNEIDEKVAGYRSTGDLKPSREILPEAVVLHDTGRPYLASSPYVPPECSDAYGRREDILTERHLWGPRDYYKADFYTQSKAHFVSETGYHGCPSVESVREIVDEGFEWPIFNEQWALHSSDQHGSLGRVHLMMKQVVQLFGIEPDDLEDFVFASQVSQAEAKKFFIERIRIGKPEKSGVIWWNMLDGWPQMSDAVVDYFFRKKLAFSYITRSQEPVCLMVGELSGWRHTVHASNDTLRPVKGIYRVYDVDAPEKDLCGGSFEIAPNGNAAVGSFEMFYSDHKFLVIEWELDGKKYFNHYLSGMPPFSLADYRRWLAAFEQIAGK